MWFKAYSQVGFCYVKMKEYHAAVQAFRTALDDPKVGQHDILDVLYVLGRSLESIGKASQALEIYHRINQSTPTYRDVANRLRELQPVQVNRQGKSSTEKHSWFSGVIGTVQRVLVGRQK